MTVLSKWGEALDVNHPLPEYPRPQFRRKQWLNLNGMWEYQIVKGNQDTVPDGWKPICVPFALGSALSQTNENLSPGETLWYRRYFAWKPDEGRVMLNFEAVDQTCIVYVNGVEAGRHFGGYAPFSIDITHLIKYQNTLMVRVKDASDQGVCAFGKQRINPKGIWYTPTAGIWGTVWLEQLPVHAVEDLKITPDFDHHQVFLELAGPFHQARIIVSARDGSFHHEGLTEDGHYVVPMDDFHAWSVNDPFLYDVEILTEDDDVQSYFGMRSFTSCHDGSGHIRFALNHQPLFLSGLLDQGYSCDGMYTYPSEEAMKYELSAVKAMGFNMLRKHVKQENRRWYYLCDTMGILVMQDMPDGGNTFSFWTHQALPMIGIRTMNDGNYRRFGRESEDSRQMYMHELDEMLDTLYNCVSIFAWVPFNEGWGQFDSSQVTDHIADYDTTRLIDSASGWHDQGCGDFNSRHVYFHAFHVPRLDQRILLLSEFGGYAYLEYGHSNADKLFGYRKFRDKRDLDLAVNALYEHDILANIDHGLAGCIYTQLSDVETECNGLLTADRRVVKIDMKKMKKMNERMQRKLI